MLDAILTLLVTIAALIALLLWRSYFPSYTAEKGKNLATREDIANITHEIEEVKTLYALQLKEADHHGALELEQLRTTQALRLAAAERRLSAHQEAFALWRKLLSRVHGEHLTEVVLECQEWWEKNCLFLTPHARDAFNKSYSAAANHPLLLQNREDAESVKQNWQAILAAGNLIVAGVELPTLGPRESEAVSTPSAV